MKKNTYLSLTAGIIISAGGLYLAFRNVPFGELTAYLRAINYLWIFPSAGIALTASVLKVVRWQIILESDRKISFWNAFHPLMIGFMLNCILPGRAGEVARPAILQRENQVPFTTGLATVAAERVFDIAFLMLLFAMVLSSISIDPNLSIPFGKYHLNRDLLETIGKNMVKLSIVLVIGILMVSIKATRNLIIRIIMEMPALFFFASPEFREKIKEKLCMFLVKMVENIASGFSLLRFPGKIFLCTILSFIIWVLSAFSYYVFSLGCPGIGLSYPEMTAVMVIICFFIALPSAPGFWGLWEAGGVFALSLFGVSSKDAAGFTLANHAFQMLPVMIVGFVSAMIIGVNIWQVPKKEI